MAASVCNREIEVLHGSFDPWRSAQSVIEERSRLHPWISHEMNRGVLHAFCFLPIAHECAMLQVRQLSVFAAAPC